MSGDMRTRAEFSAFASSLAAVVFINPAAAGDHNNLEEGLPVTIEDAFPIAYRGREVQGLVRYDNLADDPDGNHLFTLEPRFEFGAFRNFQAEIRVPYRVGSADEAETGEAAFEALYNFNAETLTLPAFALKAGVGVPFGPDTQGAETTLKAILTAGVGAGFGPDSPDVRATVGFQHALTVFPLY